MTDILSVRANFFVLARILLLYSRETDEKSEKQRKKSNIIKLEYKQKKHI